MKADIPLFSYGTLQLREVQLANYGRELDGSPDALVGYRMITLPDRDPDAVRISGTKTHFVVRRTDNPEDRVPGTSAAPRRLLGRAQNVCLPHLG